ncbi:MAG: glycoside hydrolase family 3 protein [Dictyoglomus thermophilum]|nr:glycoside hydrolase family 3 protein [Dictyoglomus thermophilum]MCX7720026.1 glycoside hydrolase family 3 protein [Dictyoglomus thermophilum]
MIKKIFLTLLISLLFVSFIFSSEESIEEKVERLLSQMTLEEKVGQMTQVDSSYLYNPEDVKRYFIGSVLSGGNSGPSNPTPANWVEYVNRFQYYALQTRLRIPILYGIDAVHGNAKVYSAVVFPHNIGLGCTRNEKLVEDCARITAIETSAIGIRWSFAPCVAVVQDVRWGRTYESFSENPDVVALLGSAVVRGFQGSSLSNKDSILACPKHFVGDGGTKFGTGINGLLDQGDTRISEKELRNIHLKPYISAIKNGAKSIMVSFSSWNGIKMHANKYLLTDVLKKELGFDGFLVSDWKAIEQLPGNYEDQVAMSINAGIDMVMVPDNYVRFINTLISCVQKGRVPISRIDDAVRRILRVKFLLGLFENPYANKDSINKIGSKEHREIARQAVRESVVVLQNKNKILPLSKNLKHICVVGPKANDIGSQCGGWTISWQGQKGNITVGTTILEAIKKSVSNNTKVTFSSYGDNIPKDAEVIVAVVGEKPYAESMGDTFKPEIEYSDHLILQNIFKEKKPIVMILLVGRPVDIENYLSKASGVICAWLPGTEGEGITDILFGDFNPKGRLSFTWYTVDRNKAAFPYGYGLSY